MPTNHQNVIAATLLPLMLLFAGATPVSRADQDVDKQNREVELRRLAGEIEELTRLMNKLDNSENVVIQKIEKLRIQKQLHLRKAEKLNIEIQSSENQILALGEDVSALETSINERKIEIGGVLRRMYLKGRYSLLRSLMKVSDSSNLETAHSFLAVIARKELNLVQDYLEDTRKLSTRQKELRSSITTMEQQRAEAKQHSRDAASAARKQEQVLEQIHGKRGIYQEALQEKIKAREDLLNLLKELSVVEESVSKTSHFLEFRGSMPWPCKGEIVARFGKIRDPVWNTTLENDGVDIKAPLNTPVKAVSAGTVIWSDWHDSRGNMVVINHGSSYYTLYAHLSRLNVKVKDDVSAGRVIGYVGETGSLKGPILHFEIRLNLEALDPVEWLKKE